ncbi:MAG: sigma-70 region 4 domain-containing protein [Stenotrophomonas maltophilia]
MTRSCRPSPILHHCPSSDCSTPNKLRHLDAIIAALPPRSRQVFLLARVEQMALAEIGRQLGISRQTAHGHLLRALVALQQVPGA